MDFDHQEQIQQFHNAINNHKWNHAVARVAV